MRTRALASTTSLSPAAHFFPKKTKLKKKKKKEKKNEKGKAGGVFLFGFPRTGPSSSATLPRAQGWTPGAWRPSRPELRWPRPRAPHGTPHAPHGTLGGRSGGFSEWRVAGTGASPSPRPLWAAACALLSPGHGSAHGSHSCEATLLANVASP